jgi:hypothetical protein
MAGAVEISTYVLYGLLIYRLKFSNDPKNMEFHPVNTDYWVPKPVWTPRRKRTTTTTTTTLVDTRAKNNQFLKENALYSIGIQKVDEFRGARVPIRAKMLNLKYGVLE